jgi:hypothetical protein
MVFASFRISDSEIFFQPEAQAFNTSGNQTGGLLIQLTLATPLSID